MADYNGFSISNPTILYGSQRYPRREGLILDPTTGGVSVTTYYYRTTIGTRGSTTDPGTIPVGAVVERIVVS